MKGGTYTKSLAEIQSRGIFRIDIRKNVLPKFIEICMETPYWCPPGWAPTWRTKNNKASATEFWYKSVNLFLEELINIKFKVDRLQIILVAKNIYIYVSQLFTSRMPKMRAILK